MVLGCNTPVDYTSKLEHLGIGVERECVLLLGTASTDRFKNSQ